MQYTCNVNIQAQRKKNVYMEYKCTAYMRDILCVHVHAFTHVHAHRTENNHMDTHAGRRISTWIYIRRTHEPTLYDHVLTYATCPYRVFRRCIRAERQERGHGARLCTGLTQRHGTSLGPGLAR